MPTWNMVPNIHLAVPLVPRGALLFLLLLSCMVFSSLSDSKYSFLAPNLQQLLIVGEYSAYYLRGSKRLIISAELHHAMMSQNATLSVFLIC